MHAIYHAATISNIHPAPQFAAFHIYSIQVYIYYRSTTMDRWILGFISVRDAMQFVKQREKCGRGLFFSLSQYNIKRMEK
jgi:hypothetical protein